MIKIKEKLYNKFTRIFKDQLNLDLTEILVLKDGFFKLSAPLLSISMASLDLDLNKEDHIEMSEFLQFLKVEC